MKYGWQLQRRTTEVAQVKRQAEARIGRLATQKKTLSVELKAATTSKKEAVQEAHRHHKADVARLAAQVKNVTRLKDEELNMAKVSHRHAVAKLEEKKAELRERAKVQKAEHKERVADVAAKNEALERLCSVADVETKKLGRELNAQHLRVVALALKETLLAKRVQKMEVENELLSDTLEKKEDESNEMSTDMVTMRADLAAKCAELDEVNERFRKWKELDRDFRTQTNAKLSALRNKRDMLKKVSFLSYSIFLS